MGVAPGGASAISASSPTAMRARGFAGIVSSESAAVMAVMRQNAKFSIAIGYGYDDADAPDDPLLEEFKAMRRKLFTWKDWNVIPPIEYLAPFLRTIRSVETSGPITGVALGAVLKVLKHGLIDVANAHAADAMHAVADAVTLCRFEATDADHDDVVLSKILHVLLECVTCPAGRLLSDDDVCNVVQACYRIGHQSGKESALMRNLSRHILREIVHAVFKGLPEMDGLRASDASEDGAGTTPGRAHHIEGKPPPSPSKQPAAAAALAEGQPPAPAPPTEQGPGAATDAAPRSPTHAGGHAADTERERADLGGHDAELDRGPAGEPFGLMCVLEIFRFSVSFVSLERDADENAEGACAFGLQLVLASLESSGDHFARHAPLLELVQDDLCRAVLSVAPAGHPPTLAAVAAVILQLYLVMHSHLKLQLEAFLRMVLLPLGEGAGGVPMESQRIALECLVDLCRQPNFVPDVYLNFDCDMERANVFEELTTILSRNAFPPQGGVLNPTHLLALEGLLAVVGGIAERSVTAPPVRECASTPSSDLAGGPNATYADIWSEMGSGKARPVADAGLKRATALRRARHLKRRLLTCAEHFNRSMKKGLAYTQEIKLLPDPLEPTAVARFLRYTPGLDKEVVGEYLGDHKDFNVSVLKQYADIFNFKGVTLDKALRSFLDGFKLPGEAQKISRILEVFAARYYGANPDAVADADSAYVLSYSIIMLNTDQHNPQVKRKMTLEQFVRNNRGTNGGEDWPRETLESIFDGIVEDEIKLTDESAPTLTPSRWVDMMRACGDGKGRMLQIPEADEAVLYDADLFAIVWSPTVAATSIVFDHAVDESVLKEALDGFLGIARVAGHHKLCDVMDHLVSTLCKFAAPPYLRGDGGGGGGGGSSSSSSSSATSKRASVRFGEDDKARTAAVTAFTVANRYGDSLRGGWRHLLDLVVRLQKLGLLSEKVRTGLGVDERDGGTMRAFDGGKASTSKPDAKLAKKSSASSSFFRFLSLEADYYGGAAAEAPLTEAEKAAEERAIRCVDACRVDEVFADNSKFLEPEALLHLVRALTSAGGPSRGNATESNPGTPSGAAASPAGAGAGAGLVVAGPEDEDVALFCLDVLVGVTLRNKDRAKALLPHVYGYLRIVVQSAKAPSPLVERAIFELVRVCRRLLPVSDDLNLSDELLDSLRLMFALEPAVADAFIERIARELCVLVSVAADKVRTQKGWDTICKLLMASARHPDAAAHGFSALSRIMGAAVASEDGAAEGASAATPAAATAEGAIVESRVRPWNVKSFVEAAAAFVDATQGGDARSIAAISLLSSACASMCAWCQGDDAVETALAFASLTSPQGASPPPPEQAVTSLRAHALLGPWNDVVGELRRVGESESRAGVRDDALLTLQRVLLAAEGLHAPPTHWMMLIDGALLPMAAALGERCRAAGAGRTPAAAEARVAAERTARIGVGVVAKTFLQYLGGMLSAATPTQFATTWHAILDAMEKLLKHAKSEELQEAVPEAVKNMLLVMSASGALAPGAPEGLWENTWKRAAAIDAGLTPSIVGAKG